MSNIEFEGDKWNKPSFSDDRTPKIARLIIKWGLVKNKNQANYILIGIFIVLIIIIILTLAR